MGNYFATPTYKDHGFRALNYEKNNNNIMTPCLVKTVRNIDYRTTAIPKLSKFVQIVTTEVTVENLYNSYRENNSAAWSKLGELHRFSKAWHSRNKTINTQLVNCRNTNLPKEHNIDKDSRTISSYNQRLRTHFEPALSESCINRLNTSHQHCYNRSKQLDTASLFLNFTTVINMVDLHLPPKIEQKTDCSVGMGFDIDSSCMDTVRNACCTSFFVDFNEPYKRYPLKKEHQFNQLDCWSDSDEDSLCSFKCNENEICEDFIVFDEEDFDGNDFCEIRISMNSRNNCVDSESTKLAKSTSTIFCDNVSKFYSENCTQKCEARARECEANSKKCSKNSRKVRFETEENLAVVYHMKHWDFAYREARKGPWELAAVDRFRFCRRIHDLELIIAPCLQRKLQRIEIQSKNTD